MPFNAHDYLGFGLVRPAPYDPTRPRECNCGAHLTGSQAGWGKCARCTGEAPNLPPGYRDTAWGLAIEAALDPALAFVLRSVRT